MSDVFDKIYAEKVAAKKDADMKSVLVKLTKSIESNNQSEAMDLFIKKLQDIQKIELPNINITNENKELILLLKDFNSNTVEIIEGQNKLIELMSIKPTRLKPVNGFGGIIQCVDIEWKDISKNK